MSEVDPKAPAEELRDEGPTEGELRKILARRTGGVEAMQRALSLAAKTAAIGLPVALIYAVISGAGTLAVLQASLGALRAEPGSLDLMKQLLFGGAAFALVYAVIQFTKRETASRESWAPALFAAPLLMAGGGLALLGGAQSAQMQPMAVQLMMMAWALLWSCFGGAAAVIAWLLAGRAAIDGQPVDVSGILHQVRSRFVEVAGPRGARVHAVSIGMQIVLPGVFYALQLAFTEMIAVLDPEKPALRRSGALTSGMRGRLFRMMGVWFLVGQVAVTGGVFAIEAATPKPAFEQLDASGDGAVSPAEAEGSTRLFTKFKAIDTDRSGSLSPAEFEKWRNDSANDVTTFEGALTRFGEIMLDPASMTVGQVMVQELIWALFSWILMLALLVLYLEREQQVKAKSALKKLRAGG